MANPPAGASVRLAPSGAAPAKTQGDRLAMPSQKKFWNQPQKAPDGQLMRTLGTRAEDLPSANTER
jgi:hypothetical protein